MGGGGAQMTPPPLGLICHSKKLGRPRVNTNLGSVGRTLCPVLNLNSKLLNKIGYYGHDM